MRRRFFATACAAATAVVLLAGAAAAVAQSGGPPEYGYGTIPFGATARQILAELSGATIDVAGPEAHFINHYEVLPDFFADGLEPDWLGIQRQFDVDVTRMWRVSYVGWINVVAMELYFYRDHDASPDDLASYRLFMVRKTLKTGGSGSHSEVSDILMETISDRLDLDPVSYDVKYLALPARIAKWATPDSDIFLLVFQNLLSASDADVLYLDRRQWRNYVAASRQESSQQTRSAGSSF